MAKKNKLLCAYCKGTISYASDSGFTQWGIRCKLSGLLHFRSFDTEEKAQRSIDEWCTGDGRRGCRPYLLRETGHSYSFSGDLLREFEAMEEHTVAKQKYYCKCGTTFEKSSTATDTGYRISDYGEDSECYGCPFVEPVTDGWGDTLRVKAYECRASNCKINYTTKTDMTLEGNYVVHVYTLDLPWLDNFIRTYLQTPGIGRSEPDKLLAYDPPRLAKAFHNAGINNGRESFAFEFKPNKTGKAARKAIFEKFFNEDKTAQMGPGPGGDKERILHMIEHAKAEAKEKTAKMEDDILGADKASSVDACPYFAGTKPKKGGGHFITCQTSSTITLTYKDDSGHIMKLLQCTKGEQIKCRCFLFSQLQEAGLQPSSEHSDEELCNMYNGLMMKQGTALVSSTAPAPPPPPLEAPSPLPRDITDVTAEIRFYKAQTVQNIIEIGKRLNEAKAMLEHGQWGEWLQNEVEFSQDTAGNFMRIAEDYPNSDAPRNLSYTKIVTLLSLPAPVREEFIAVTHTVNGVDKTVEEMSTRELQKVIKERDEAKKTAEGAEKRAKEAWSVTYSNQETARKYKDKFEEQQQKMKQLKDENRRQQQDIERLESRPIDIAVQQPSDEDMDVLRENIRHTLIGEMALPNTYLAKKGLEEAPTIFMDAVSGAVSNFLFMAMQMDGTAALKNLDVCIGTLENQLQELRGRKNMMLVVDRSKKEGSDDLDF